MHERTEDIPLLAFALLKQLDASKEFSFSPGAKSELLKHAYKGNIRELRNILSRALVFGDTRIISGDTIRSCFFDQVVLPPLANQDATWQGDIGMDLKSLEHQYINSLLARHADDKEKVAAILGICVRSLYRKLD